ncbi:MAG: gamma-glutamylcyclotransferase [Daejeonella sp.]
MENTDDFYYFAYASNLKISILEERIGDKIQNCLPGRLPDYGFRFNRRNSDGSARANIVVSESEDVYGLVCRVDQKYKDKLLKTEPGYLLISVAVETEQGDVNAFTFISESDDEGIYPTKQYLNSILEGAREQGLPEEYVDFIIALAT